MREVEKTLFTHIATAMDKLQEQYLLEAFGSEENVLRFKDDFYLEQYPVEVDAEQDGNLVTFKFKQQLRIVKKGHQHAC